MARGCEIVTSAVPPQVSPDKRQFIYRHGLASPQDVVRWSAISRGVSSDLWRVEAPDRTFCVKAALPTLRVKADWHAPLDRSSVEVAWLKFASEQVAVLLRQVLADDPAAGIFAMNYFDPIEYPVWKSELMAHRINDGTAERVGDLVGRLAEASVQRDVREDLSRRFATDDNFRLLRIEPYFLATARRRPEVADRLRSLAERTSSIRRGLVHGDVSPKNILVGQGGPVLIDAECAWWGDPAFDVAFCLNHLLLKALVVDTQRRPARAQQLSAEAHKWWAAYREHITWESPSSLGGRVVDLLPALLLARVDGTSPVEYLTAEADRTFVRDAAVQMLSTDDLRGINEPSIVFDRWRERLSQ